MFQGAPFRATLLARPRAPSARTTCARRGSNKMPIRAGIGVGRHSLTNEGGAVHLPDVGRAVVVLPKDAAAAVAIEVSRCNHMPCRAGVGVGRHSLTNEGGAVHLPDVGRAVV